MVDNTMAEALVEAMTRIAADTRGKERPVFGVIECPRCGGRLSYAIRGPRAHAGKCLTANCLDWIG
jgi:hypothetical protein